MSGSSSAQAAVRLADAAETALVAAEQLMASGATGEVADETVQRLLLAGMRLYAQKSDSEQRAFPALPETGNATATEVAVTVTDMMRVVDLNMFDLAMWSGRAQPHEGS